MISRVVGTVLTDDEVDYLLRALELLCKLLERQQSKPTPRLEYLFTRLGKTAENASATAPNASSNASYGSLGDIWGDDVVYAITSPAEAATIIGCTPSNVRDLVRRRVLRARRSGGRVQIDTRSVLEYAARRRR